MNSDQLTPYESGALFPSIEKFIIQSEAAHLAGQLNLFVDMMEAGYAAQNSKLGYPLRSADRSFDGTLKAKYGDLFHRRVKELVRSIVSYFPEAPDPMSLMIFDSVVSLQDASMMSAEKIKETSDALLLLVAKL